jgi:hypothetical protein
MKIQQLTIILFFTFLFLNVNAQEFKLGKVSIAELREKSHPKDSSAVAAILFQKGEVKFDYSEREGFTLITEVKTRVKIYKKEGYGNANQEVVYYIENGSNDVVSFSNVVTYNLVDGKIEKTQLKSDGEFDEKINKYWGKIKITMPNVKVGSVLEFQYSIKSPRYRSLKKWDFQTSIPVNYSEFTTFIPEFFIYNSSQKGFIIPKITVLKRKNEIVINSKERTGGQGFSNVKTTFSEDKIEYTETQTSYLAENLPAMKDEKYVNNIDNYTSSISNELSMTRFPNQAYETFSTNWEAVAKTIYEYSDFGPELNKTDYFEKDVDALLVGLKNRDEIIAVLLNFVKTNIKWSKYYGYSCNDGVKKAYKDKTGNTAEINLMLTAMLRYAGLNANPVLVSTRNNGIVFFPSRTAFNCVIAAVETPEGFILLDATEQYSEPNILPLRDLNWVGRLIRKDGTSIEVDLMPKMLSKEAISMSVILKSDGSADGKLRKQLTNQEALGFRKENSATNVDSYLEKLENDYNDIEISDYVRENNLDLSKPIVETFTFKDTKDIEVIDGKIYISPMLYLVSKENPFKQEIREFPVDFGYPKQERYNININIPEGFVIETMPKPMNILTGEDVGAFKYVIATTKNTIQVVITKDINTAIVPADFYPVLKDFYQQITYKQNEKIVLKKN